MDEDTEQPEMIPIVNSDARTYQLHAYTTPPQEPGASVEACGVCTERVLPGLNYLPADFIEKARVPFSDDGRVRGYEDSLRFQDPAEMPEFAVKVLASVTASRRWLRRWLDAEKRLPVREAIDARLGEIG